MLKSIEAGLGGRGGKVLMCVAVVVKVLLLFVLLPWLQGASPTSYQADKFPDWYDLLAQNIADGHGYRFFPETTATMLRTPAWPLILAGLFKLFGPSIFAVKVFNVLCSVGTGWLTYLLGQRITASRLLAAVAALIAFFHPAILISDSRGGVESFFMLVLMVFVLLAYQALERGSIGRYAAAGLALGLLLLIKSTAVLFAPCIFVCLVLKRHDMVGIRSAILSTAVLSLAATAVLSPWIIRNYRLSGEFVPTMSVGGMSSYSGYYVATHRYTGRDQSVLDLEASQEMGKVAEEMGLRHLPGYYTQFYNIADEVKFYRHLGEIVRQKYRETPGAFRTALYENATGFWIRGRSAKATMLNVIVVLPFLALFIAGAWVGWRRQLPVLPIVLMVTAFYVVHIPILGQARYHVPLIPMMAILASMVLLPWLPGAKRSVAA